MSSDSMGYMGRALELALQGPISDNPRVGAVIVRDGVIVGEGFHHGAGTPHAEVMAITQAGPLALGGHIYVTLEPCCHHGRTGPCTTAILDAGLTSVTYAQADPTEEAGGGGTQLVDSGVAVVGGILSDRAHHVNRAWTHWVTTGKPWVTWKFAQTLDARVAAAVGERTQISGPTSHQSTHQLRADVDAIVVGMNTIRIDDPVLTARDQAGALRERQPVRVVVGNSEIPSDAQVLTSPGGELVHYRKAEANEILADLAGRGVRHVLLEGGPTLARAFLTERAVNEVMTVIAPRTFGSGPAPVAGQLPSGITAEQVRWDILGNDLVLSAYVAYR